MLKATLAALVTASALPASASVVFTHRVLATAYCQIGHTATGTYVHHGSIAVDPNVIRLGTRLFVPGYGWGKAEDVGGGVRGWHIDVWIARCSDALRWGVREKTVTIAP